MCIEVRSDCSTGKENTNQKKVLVGNREREKPSHLNHPGCIRSQLMALPYLYTCMILSIHDRAYRLTVITSSASV